MKFLCGSCRTKYQISDQKVRGKILTIRCKKCGAKVIVKESLAQRKSSGIAVAPVADEVKKVEVERPAKVVQGGGSLSSAFEVAMRASPDDMPTSIAPVPANQKYAGVEWYVAIDGSQHGPYAFADLVKRIEESEILPRHYAWHDGFDGWKRVRDVEDLAEYVPETEEKSAPPPLPPDDDLAKTTPALDEDRGNVVDFAKKRAERAALAAAVSVPFDIEPTETASLNELPPPEDTEGGEDEDEEIPTSPPSAADEDDRREELDDVLNQALGISGEGRTAKASPQQAASAAQAAIAASAGVEAPPASAIAYSDKKADAIGDIDDIFASVPRASDSELVAKEKTNFFVAAAGVNKRKSRNRVGLLIGLVVGLGIMGTMASMALGLVHIEIPGLGNPFEGLGLAGKGQQFPVESNVDTKLSEADRAALAGGGSTYEDNDEPDDKRKAKRRRRRRRRPEEAAPARPSGEYVVDDEGQGREGTGLGSRGGTAKPVDISGALATRKGPTKDPLDVELPSAAVELPPADGERLTAGAIRSVVASGQKAVEICYQKELRGNENVRGKLEFLVTVEPTGVVTRSSVRTAKWKGTALGSCIASKIKEWRFPKFAGEPQQIVIPFVFERQSF